MAQLTYDEFLAATGAYDAAVDASPLPDPFCSASSWIVPVCVKVGSAGKTFSLTGWKVGYVSAAPSVLQPVAKAHQFLTFTTPPNLQQAVAFGLRKDRSYFDDLATFMARQRDKLAKGLAEVGFDVLDCAGTYFIDVDLASLGWTAGDVAFCQRLVREVGVATVPIDAVIYGPVNSNNLIDETGAPGVPDVGDAPAANSIRLQSDLSWAIEPAPAPLQCLPFP